MSIEVKQSYGEKFKPLLKRIKEKALNMSRQQERGIVNRQAKSSIAMRENGDINVVASSSAQQKLNTSGKATEIATQSEIITNTRKLTVDEIIINNHKLNSKLYEYTDLKSVLEDENKIITGIGLESTVLVKAWEPSLKKYVLIRRPARFAPFSPLLNTPEIHPDLGISSDLSKEFEDTVDIESAANQFNDFVQTK